MIGGSRGIGRAVAEAYAVAGAHVVVNGRAPEAVGDTVGAVLRAGGSAIGVVGSASEPAVVAECRRMAEVEFGAVDALVVCAGAPEPPGSSILTIGVEEWRELIDAHLTTAFLACREFAPGMVERGRGSIVLTSSHAATGMYGGTGYPAGKGAINSLVYALAAELGEHGVRVNAVAPGARTRLSQGPDYEAQIADLHARGLIDDVVRDASLSPSAPEYVAPLYLFLGSDAGSQVSGEVLVAAGGYLGRFAPPADQFLAWRDAGSHPPYTRAEIADVFAPGER
ncbi:SDR family NAD(P)-dependent oxidoreductase [Nocardioides sp. R-C-SC26]|uniref:SDR family NAD(P)-dependent oxidoreductase n=1 Tax=Nocardioides sp. R-C-SC26 TaxID=2870414 RepID=UPI001E299235|nr:SDR family oxidoreductase [Nocardioides sp. R-C-SC26]